MSGWGAMGSTFGWLDHSERQRDRMLEVVSLFHEQGTVDELGIGLVRDAISDRLFPGLSVLHTRARYLLFVPWLAVHLERERVESRRAPARFRQLEVRLIEALIAGDAGLGILGSDARARLKRLPSLVYWGALRRFGILRYPGTTAQYLRSLDTYHELRRRGERSDEGTTASTGLRANWHEELPPEPDGLLDVATFVLPPEEADYLEERILASVPDSLLAHLIRSGELADVALPWLHPAVASASDDLRQAVRHAHAFSLAMHGAMLLYNLLLAEAVAGLRGEPVEHSEAVATYRNRLDAWAEDVEAGTARVQDWDLDAFWAMVSQQNPRIGPLTRAFVDRWVRLVADHPAGIAEDAAARGLVRDREVQSKGGLARVVNTRALERWSGASGLDRLDFRWSGAARRITEDLIAAREHAIPAAS